MTRPFRFGTGYEMSFGVIFFKLVFITKKYNNAYVIPLVRRPVKGCRILKCFVNQQSNLSASKISAHLYWKLSRN